MAITAVGVTVLYYGLVGAMILLIGMGLGGGLQPSFFTNAAVGLLPGAIGLSAIVAPLLFLTGIASWRVVSPSRDNSGAIGGLLAVGLAYLVAGVLVVVLAPVYAVITGSPIGDSVVGALGIIFGAFLASSWIAVPACMFTGTLYERSLDD
jgi:hypothetical protein